MTELTRNNARRIIEALGSSGLPPEYGLQEITAGLDKYLSVIENDYLSSFILDGGAAFKLLIGSYGGGKTHFLYNIRELAWQHNYAVSYVSLTSSGESPFNKLELVYKAMVKGLIPPSTQQQLLDDQNATGILQFLKSWYMQRLQQYSKNLGSDSAKEQIVEEIKDIRDLKSISFANAIRNALLAIYENNDEKLSDIGQWLEGENYTSSIHRHYGILQKIDKSTALTTIRSLVQCVRLLGYSGLVVLLDEADRVVHLPKHQRSQHMANLRELVDECARSTSRGLMAFYAVPDENFLEGNTADYVALQMRLATVFDDVLNPTGVKIKLEDAVGDPIKFLKEVGFKIQKVYEVAYGEENWDQELCEILIKETANAAHEERYGDIGYKRIFVQNIVRNFQYLRAKKELPKFDKQQFDEQE